MVSPDAIENALKIVSLFDLSMFAPEYEDALVQKANMIYEKFLQDPASVKSGELDDMFSPLFQGVHEVFDIMEQEALNLEMDLKSYKDAIIESKLFLSEGNSFGEDFKSSVESAISILDVEEHFIDSLEAAINDI